MKSTRILRVLMKRLIASTLALLLLVSSTSSCDALEIVTDVHAPIVDLVTAKVLSCIEDCFNGEAAKIEEIVKSFSIPVDLESAAKRITESSAFINALEGGQDTLNLSLASAPSVVTVTKYDEVTVLALFSVNGEKIKSGMLILQLIQPAAVDGKITCGVKFGQLAFSPLHLVD